MAAAHGSGDIVHKERDSRLIERAQWLAMPLWRKTADFIAFLLLVVGPVFAKFAWSIADTALGFGIALAGLAVFGVTHVTLSRRGLPLPRGDN